MVGGESSGEQGGSLWEKTVDGAKEAMKARVEKRREMMAMAGKGGKAVEGMDLDK